MKNLLHSLITMIAILGFSATSFAYTLTSKDNTLITALTQKIEQVISDRGEKTREPLVKAIQDLAKKYSKQPRIYAILHQVAENIESYNRINTIIKKYNTNVKYKKEWGKLILDYDLNTYGNKIVFNNLSKNSNYIEYNNFIFSLYIQDYNSILSSYDRDYRSTINLNFYEDILKEVDYNDGKCTVSLSQYNDCIKLDVISIKDNKIISVLEKGLHDYVTKNWVYMFDDKFVFLTAELIDNNKIVDYNKYLSGNSNFGIDEDKLAKLDLVAEDFLSFISFETINTNLSDENIEIFKSYKDKLYISENSKDYNLLDTLSDSKFIKVRANIARNLNTSVYTLIKLANDISDYVKVGVKYNINTPKEISDQIENPF